MYAGAWLQAKEALVKARQDTADFKEKEKQYATQRFVSARVVNHCTHHYD